MENFNYREFNVNNPSFIGFVNQGKIFNSYNQQIGVTLEEYNKALNVAKEYKKVLEDKGIIPKEKTPEEIQKELQETINRQNDVMAKMAETIKLISEKVNNLEEKKDVEQANGSQSGEQIFKSGKSK